MGFFDIITILLLTWGLYKGVSNGLLKELASIVGIILGIWGAIELSGLIAKILNEYTNWPENYLKTASFGVVLVLIIVLVNYGGNKITVALDKTAFLKTFNKVSGGLFGVIKYCIIIGSVVFFFDTATNVVNLIPKEEKKQSHSYQILRSVGAVVFSEILKDELKKPEDGLKIKSPTEWF